MVVNARYLTIDIVNLLYKYDTLNQEKPNLFIYLLNPPSPPLPNSLYTIPCIWFQLQSPSKINAHISVDNNMT